MNKTVLKIVLLVGFLYSSFNAFVFLAFFYSPKLSDREIRKLDEEEKKKLEDALKQSTNAYIVPPFYDSDKKRIENAFRICYDSIAKNHSTNGMNLEILGINYDDTLNRISVDTILYNDSFDRLFVTALYQSDKQTYSGLGFIGYRARKKDAVIKLFPTQIAVFPFTDKEVLIRQLRTEYFINIREASFSDRSQKLIKYKYSPLDLKFWKGPFFVKFSPTDTFYPFEIKEVWNQDDEKFHIFQIPFLTIY